MTATRLRAVLGRTWREAGDDNIDLMAAGVAFYGLIALAPLLGAGVLLYGLIADPVDIVKHMATLARVLPTDAAELLRDQLLEVERTSGARKGFGLAFALAFALFGARNCALSVITALNIAYELPERRSLVRLNLLGLAITLGAVAIGILAVAALAALGHLRSLLPGLPTPTALLGRVLMYLGLTVTGTAGAATLYKLAPAHRRTGWRWLAPGSLTAGMLWLAVTLGFGFYVNDIAHYGATYGSLSAVIVLLVWLYLSAYVLILGAELNCELERDTPVVGGIAAGPHPAPAAPAQG